MNTQLRACGHHHLRCDRVAASVGTGSNVRAAGSKPLAETRGVVDPRPVVPSTEQTTSGFFLVAYAELRRIAVAQLARWRPGQTLQPTMLVHEAFFKLQADARWNGSAHFFGAAAQAMREIVVDHARRKAAKKRGGHGARESAAEVALDLEHGGLPLDEVLAIDAALRDLASGHPRKASVVVMRYFGGMSNEQIADVMGVTTRTVEREWRFARILLAEALSTGPLAKGSPSLPR
jgi:RNA polymerase sigma factor (TIGR02999 family)